MKNLDLSPEQIRQLLDTIRKRSQCPHMDFWESLNMIDAFLVSKQLASQCPVKNVVDVVKANKIYYRKEDV